jgi:hypothetical protein
MEAMAKAYFDTLGINSKTGLPVSQSADEVGVELLE